MRPASPRSRALTAGRCRPAADTPGRAAAGDVVLHARRGFRARFARQLVLCRLHHLLCDGRAGGARRAPRPLHQGSSSFPWWLSSHLCTNSNIDTGTKPPESGVFGFMINISALLAAITMYIRYLLIEKQNESSHFVWSSCNMFTLCVGLMGCTGMGIVATFQELAVPSVHDIGALVAFGSGVVYITLQSIISYKSSPRWNTYFVCHIRMAISVISCIAFIPMIVFASKISMTKIDWTPGEKDYTYHFMSAICEWTVAFGFIFFFLTFIRDFQRFSLRISTEIHEDSW
ncbi:PREDICTED: DNA damage-regulated autophagy modulator protein 1 isoform X1 [Pseudopodoces humilis]|uniref:DNA damage-regulated autophagy modulator protein 1 isoform X1 n=1 Tax=Pseudopodoces humilis TaxID=181119 RepID=UPI0006B6B052|nr:PREDICTED: DNA damage-regulated autophagy modulator protein 1 isoform X1 [Pseudopodoces humilis]